MYHHIRLFVLGLWLAGGLFACAPADRNEQAKDELAVRDCFNSYKQAILAGNGNQAQMMVDIQTIQFYERVINHARFSEKAQLSKAGLSEKLIVFDIRARIAGDSIRKFSGRQLFATMVDKEMIDKSAMTNIEIGEVEVTGNTAKAGVQVEGKKAPFTLRFSREDEQWKINIAALLAITDMALTEKINQAGLTEDYFIEQIMKLKGIKKTNSQYWEPLH